MTPLDPLAIPLSGTNLIEASAGTGKTHAITNLYVRLLLELRLSVSQILVVTYTNAATAELRARIRRRVHEALVTFDAGGGEDEFLDRLARQRREQGALAEDRAHLLVALHGFDEAAIFTIHGFCQRMLEDNAFESGVAFDTEVVANESPLVTEVVQDFWVRELHAAPEPFVRHLVDARVTLAKLENLAIKVVRHRDMPVLPGRDDPVLRAVDDAGNPSLAACALALQRNLAEYARDELRRRKEQARVQSFDDLLQRLAEALREPGGATLAALIRRRFRAALIDEFQDTDPVQYEIFRRVYLGSDAVLFLIGDPKQAIYAFRGADVFAYIQAKHDVGGEPHTLGTNQRSDPSLIKGVSALFGRLRKPFVFDEIPFLPVAAAPAASDRLGGTAAGQPPLQILFVRRMGQEGRGGAINKPWGEGEGTAAIAADIVRFLGSGATIGERRVEPGDIAVLCRTNKQASLMQQALRELGVPSVLQGDASVFETPEAEEMERVLQALADPGDARGIRAALGTTLLGQNAQDLAALEHDEQRWDEWVWQFQDLHEQWTQRSFVAAFRALLDAQRVPQRLLGFLDGERRLTNVLHLMELLHTAGTQERRGPHALVQWLHQMQTDAGARAELAGEAAQIRLESDAAAVKLTTIHKSKGLQYPIVYCPYLWDGALLHKSDKEMLRFHDSTDDYRLKLDIGSSDHAVHLGAAEREAFAENVRLLYVALTRARHRCTVVWGAFRSAPDSALGYVLHQPSGVSGDPRAATTALIKSFIGNRDDAGMRADLEGLATMAPGSIAVADLSLEHAGRYAAPTEAMGTLHCRAANRELRRTWRVSSFSALTSSAEVISLPAAEGLDHDATEEIASTAEPGVPLPDQSLVVLHDFPAGARAGQLIHEVLETFDFQTAEPEVLRDAVTAALARFGFEDKWAEVLCRALAAIVGTPLNAGAPSLRLRDIARERRLNELEFLFPIAGQEVVDRRQPRVENVRESVRDDAVLLTRERLAAVFAQHATAPVPADYAARLRSLGFAPLTGFLKGFIDLVFEHDGRWYVVDYKSNRLGPHPDDYGQPQVIAAMVEHHYFLQYHLYVVALHRYLTRRLPGYDYDRHFGGVYYLFLRGMAPEHYGGNGVFFDRPSRQLIENLSEALAGHAEGSR
ncbi:MAG: exodeoxyribonuclease V subunit beta [Candidatus Binatia bacterium]